MTSLQEAERLWKEAQKSLSLALDTDNSIWVQETLLIYQQILDMNLEIAEPYLGIAFLTLCAQDYPMVERLLASAERIDPGSLMLHQLKHYLATERQKTAYDVTDSTPPMIEEIKRLKTPMVSNKRIVSGGCLPRSLQRILGPLEGLFQHPDELAESLKLAFGTSDLVVTQQLWAILQLRDPIDLAKTLKDLQSLLTQIHPLYNRKMSTFAHDLSSNQAVRRYILIPLLQRLSHRMITFDELHQNVSHLSPDHLTSWWIEALFKATQDPEEADFEVLLDPEQWGEKKESESLRRFAKWLSDFESQ